MKVTDIIPIIQDTVHFGRSWRHWGKFQFTASLSAVSFLLELYSSLVYGPDIPLVISTCVTAILFTAWGAELWNYVERPVKNAQRVREYRRRGE